MVASETPGAGGAARSTARALPGSGRHLPALDGIRGLAIIWVAFHNTLSDNFAPAGGPLHVVALFANLGWIGVQLFFALSGFLITAGLLESQGADNYFSGFYVKRALRILPLYYAVLFASLVLVPRLAGSPSELQTAVDHQAPLWLFVINWTHTPAYGFGHFWSLAVEEQFYLVWPLLVYRLSPQRLLKVCLWIALGALLTRGVMRLEGASEWTLYSATPGRMDALGLGAAGACLVRIPSLRDRTRRHLSALAVASFAAFLLGVPLTGIYDVSGIACQTIGYTVLAWCSAALVTGVAMTDGAAPSWVSQALRWRPLRSCGRYSYAMYVFHELLHKLVSDPWVGRQFGSHPPAVIVFVASLATIVASYGLAFVSYHTFEKHFLALKRLAQPPPRPN